MAVSINGKFHFIYIAIAISREFCNNYKTNKQTNRKVTQSDYIYLHNH